MDIINSINDHLAHVIPNDDYNHIESYACGCSPELTTVGNQDVYIHNEINEERIRDIQTDRIRRQNQYQ